jgi:hypothetical protein
MQGLHNIFRGAVAVLAASTLAFAQEAPPPPADSPAPSSSGWKRVGDQSGQTTAQAQPVYQPPQGGYQTGQPNYGSQPNYGPQNQQPAYQPAYQPPPVPASLTVARGTFLTVRVNQLLSSDKNQAGDAFSASLVQPVVVNGVVVAEPGQTLGGRVAEAQKAGHVEGTARLGIQLTELTLVDGQQVPLQSALISRKGPTSVGQDAGTIAATTGLGAAIGAAADWGRGAAIGAGAGAAAGIIGVLVTRGHPSVIYPEQILTLRVEAPITIATDRSPQAFRYIQPNEYDRPYDTQPAPYAQAGPYGAAAPAPYYGGGYGYPYPYYAYGYPYYYGPGFSFIFGRGYGGWGGNYYYLHGPYYGGGYFRGGGGVVRGGGFARHR